jgi:hypothetical protein
VLDQDLNEQHSFPVKSQYEYSTISRPDSTSKVISVSNDQTTLFWYKNNVSIERIDCKTLNIIKSYKNIVKLIDIEKLMSIRLENGMKYLYYFTKKNMLGDTLYKLNLHTGKKMNSWDFTNKLRKFTQKNSPFFNPKFSQRIAGMLRIEYRL